jgi:hypothetical protein
MNDSPSRRIAERLLTLLLPRDYCDALIGDLREEDAGSLYWREVAVAVAAAIVRTLLGTRNETVSKEEVMAALGTATHRPVAFALSLGVLGGGALITTMVISRRGPYVLLAYAAIVLVTAIILRAEFVQPFSRRFLLSLGAFMLATLILHVFLRTVPRGQPDISIFGHAWRIGFMLLVGSVLSAAVAQLTATTGRTPIPDPLTPDLRP